MSSSNILRLLRDALALNGERLDLASGDVLKVRPGVDDTGSVNIGDGTYDMDVKTFLGATTKYILMDVGNSRLQLEDVDMLLGDNDHIDFGDGNDMRLKWNGTYLEAGPASGMWAGAPSPADPQYNTIAHEFFDDFKILRTEWTVAETDAGNTEAVGDSAGGTVLLTNGAADDDSGSSINWANETFYLAAGKTIWYECYIKAAARKAGANSEIDLSIGLGVVENLTAVMDNFCADGIAFTVTDGAKVWQITASKGGTNTGTVTTTVDLTAGWIKLGLLIDGVTSITPYINGTAQTALTTTIPDDQELSPFFMVRNGDATITQTLEVDYVKVVQLR